MKLLVFLSVLFSSLVTFAGPGDTPVFPWPTNVVREGLFIEDLRGDWVAYGHNAVWFISIHSEGVDNALNSITIESEALFSHKAIGTIYFGDNILWGKLIMNKSHTSTFMIYKDHDGTKIRLAKNTNQFIDLKLYRKK